MKSRKRLARDVFDIFATHTGLVYDVNDPKRQLSHSGFRDFQTKISFFISFFFKRDFQTKIIYFKKNFFYFFII